MGYRKKTIEEYKEEVFNTYGEDYTILGEYVNNKEKILTRHNLCGTEYMVSPNQFVRKDAWRSKRCPNCPTGNPKSTKKKTLEGCKKEIYDLVGDEYILLSTEYNGNKSKLKFKHSVCEKIFYTSLYEFTKENRRCPKCTKNTTIKKTTEQFREDIYNLVGDEYVVLGDYINNKTPILMRHNICGYEWKVAPLNFLDGSRCPVENISSNIDTEVFEKRLQLDLGEDYIVLGEYINTATNVLVTHLTCGTEYMVAPNHSIPHYRKCPTCTDRGLATRKTKKEFQKELNLLKNNEYTVLGDYVNNHTKILMKHNACGHEWETTPMVLLLGCGCPRCANNSGTSKTEIEVGDYIRSLSRLKVVQNSKSIIKPLELDIYIPSLKLAIEFDGLYWHSEIYKDKNYHLNKTTRCQELGIRLIHIFEDEWMYKQEIVKSKLKNLICKDSIKIYGRKCWVEEIDSSSKNTFLNENHIQGSDKSNIKLSLWTNINNEEICVAVMTFCKPRRSLGQKGESSYDYELSRYASQSGYSVIGGFSKLLKYFERKYEWKKIITYADIKWSSSDSNVYLTNGFTYLHSSKPNYWYIRHTNNYERFHRYGYRKQVLKEKFPEIYNDDKTEKEIMKEAGFIRIYDCGNMVYEYIKQ